MKKPAKNNNNGETHVKKKGRKGAHHVALSRETVDKMFVHWIQQRNASLTAREFGVSNSVVYKYINNEGWDHRADEIENMKQKEVARRIVKQFKSNLDAVKSVKDKVLQEILASNRLNPTVADLMRLIEYEDDALSGGETGKQNIILQIVTAIIEGGNFGSDEDRAEDEEILRTLEKQNRFKGN